MKSAPRADHPDAPREIRIIAILTVIGALIRFWNFPRLGLNHFDEGIYALAGLWIFSPHGLMGLDPSTIAYAPPGLVTLIGLAYGLFGVGDYAAIFVSLVAGTLTIPAVGWVAARTFGSGAGAAAAGLAALAGPHIAFSRMALTDTLFLLCWTITLGLAQRFLERPGALRAVLLGLGVGAAQLVKYNGYLLGIIAAVSACVWVIVDRSRPRTARIVPLAVWGFLGALVSVAVYAPWIQFVERHGGYQALIAHHRSYLGSVGSWPSYLWVQLAEARVLSGGPIWTLCGGIVALLAVWTCSSHAKGTSIRFSAYVLQLSAVMALAVSPNFGWWLTIVWLCAIPGLLLAHGRFNRAQTVIAIGSMGLMILTPFYHPYARLWLPLHAFGWMIGGGLIAWITRSHSFAESLAAFWPRVRYSWADWAFSACLLAVFAEASHVQLDQMRTATSIVCRTDGLSIACAAVRADVPKTVSRVRLFARPSLTFYLAGQLPLELTPSWDKMQGQANDSTWAIVDSAMLRQQGQSGPWRHVMGRDWVLVNAVDARLGLPTLLDIEPTAALNDSWEESATILLFRPVQAGCVQ